MQTRIIPTSLIAFSDKSEDAQLLTKYLYEVRHQSARSLIDASTFDIVQDTLREFYVFVGPGFGSWWSLFITYANDLIRFLGRPEDELLWVIRSYEFTQYANSLLNVG